jgi:molecular chaperone GrpE
MKSNIETPETENIESTEQSKDQENKDKNQSEDTGLSSDSELLEAAQKKCEETYDRFIRVAAEFENYKKRTEREKTELRKYANESLLRELLSVADNLERALDSPAKDDDAQSEVIKGIELTLKETLKILEKSSVKAIDCLGKKFDPKFHQAMMQEPSSEHPDNTVLKELQKGYLIHDRLLRPAMVIVSKDESQVKETKQDEED